MVIYPMAARGRVWRKLLLSLAVLAGSAAWVRHVALHPVTAEEAALLPVLLPGPGTLTDGTFPGSVEDAHYGDLKLTIVVQDGRMVRIRPMKYPHHTPASEAINQRAFRSLFKQAIANQSATVDVVSGATYTSEAFVRSLTTALTAAKG